jgi:branched-chain amino acid transport system ATP-binding protein
VLLEVKGVSSGYHRKPVLRDVSLSVGEGEVVGLIGHNGAGKTTALRTILGLLRADAGEVRFDGRTITGQPAVRSVRDGLYLVPQERFTFPDLAVRENLMLGAARSRRSTTSSPS